MHLRTDFLKQKRIPQTFFNTQFDFIDPDLRYPLVKSVLPFIWQADKKAFLESALAKQDEWPQFKPGRSAWKSTRRDAESAAQQNIVGLEEAMDEDLVILGYTTLLKHLPNTIMSKPEFFRKALEDFFLNLYYIVEELRLSQIAAQHREPSAPPQNSPVGFIYRLLSYPELDTQMHAQGAINRIRAGWDKLITNLATDSFGIPRGSKDGFPKRVQRVLRELPELLNGQEQVAFIKNLVENAQAVEESWVRTGRDADLHFISRQTVEMFGDLERGLPADELVALAFSEHRRLEQSFLLLIGALALANNEQ